MYYDCSETKKGASRTCLLRGSNQCRKPNQWNEFQSMNRGKTRAAMSGKYASEKKKAQSRFLNETRICESVRARGKQHELSITKIGNPVDFYIKQPEVKTLKLFNARRFKIEKDIKSLRSNFASSRLTQAAIREVFNAIDKHYFAGSVLSTIPMAYEIVDDQKSPASAWVTPLNPLKLTVNQAKWGNRYPKIVDSILCKSKLRSLLVTLEHEFLHMLMHKYKPQGPGEHAGHGLVFRALNNRIFGHSQDVYTYVMDIDIIDLT